MNEVASRLMEYDKELTLQIVNSELLPIYMGTMGWDSTEGNILDVSSIYHIQSDLYFRPIKQ